jgi:hypothetical protein
MKWSKWINGFEWVESPYPWTGTIPPIAEKEKRGKPVRRPKDENYVRDIKPKWDGLNIPAAN